MRELKTKAKIRNCAICEKEIKTKRMEIGSRKEPGSTRTFTDSEEGVFFNFEDKIKTGKWFCNPCWVDITYLVKKHH